MKNILLSIVILMTISACQNQTESQDANAMLDHESYEVKFHGALKNAMMNGDVSAKGSLSEIADLDHVYAVGAFENLEGEVQVFDGKPLGTFVDDGVLAFDTTLNRNTSLLVYANVENWQDVTVDEGVITYKQLESFVAETAEAKGIDIHKPFPFLLTGVADSISWHVINWPAGDMEHTHEKHITSGLHGTRDSAGVEILGFYSDAHKAIFTHHTTNMHLHVRTTDGTLAGHLDGLTLGQRMTLKLPAIN